MSLRDGKSLRSSWDSAGGVRGGFTHRQEDGRDRVAVGGYGGGAADVRSVLVSASGCGGSTVAANGVI